MFLDTPLLSCLISGLQHNRFLISSSENMVIIHYLTHTVGQVCVRHQRYGRKQTLHPIWKAGIDNEQINKWMCSHSLSLSLSLSLFFYLNELFEMTFRSRGTSAEIVSAAHGSLPGSVSCRYGNLRIILNDLCSRECSFPMDQFILASLLTLFVFGFSSPPSIYPHKSN